jgi:hypothetical protein
MLVNSTAAHAMSVSLTIRRLGFTLLLAILITSAVALIEQDAAALIFLPSWLGLFFAWPYLCRKFGFNFPKGPAQRQSRRTEWGRMFITGFISFALSCAVTFVIHPDLFGPSFLFFWVILYYASPLLTKRMPYFGFAKTISTVAVPTPKRPLWRRMVRGSLAGIGIVFTIVLIPMMILVPLSLSHLRAKKVHDSIHTGMTVPEVVHTGCDCDIFQASSDFPYDNENEKDADNIPAMSLGRSQDGAYHTYDLASRQTLNLSESEAIDRLHARLHDGYPWHFHYTYINVTPQHVSFSVDFGADGRVSQVRPVHGWD